MKLLATILAGTVLGLGMRVSPCMAQQDPARQTVRGELVTIKGEEYVVRDSFGRFLRLTVTKETKQERMILLGDKVEVQMWSNGQAIAIKPAQ